LYEIDDQRVILTKVRSGGKIEQTIMSAITANEIKTRGIAVLETALENAPDPIISVRGKDRFVVMDIAHYHHLRECELESAWREAKADVAAGRVVRESPVAHVKRVTGTRRRAASPPPPRPPSSG
jgi:hypothetical protein